MLFFFLLFTIRTNAEGIEEGLRTKEGKGKCEGVEERKDGRRRGLGIGGEEGWEAMRRMKVT